MGCKGIVPGWSLFAAILQCLGVAMFCSSAVLGVNEFLNLLKDDSTKLEMVDKNVIYIIEICLYTLTAVTMVWAIGCLFNAFLLNAQANSPVWENSTMCCISTGCVGFSVFVNTVAMVEWIAITGASVVPFTFSIMLREYHDMLYNETTPAPLTEVDFSYYGLPLDTMSVENLGPISNDLIIFFSLTVSGAAMVSFGLVCTIACLSSSWVRLKVGDKWKGYAEKLRTDEMELRQMNVHKSSEQLANHLYY